MKAVNVMNVPNASRQKKPSSPMKSSPMKFMKVLPSSSMKSLKVKKDAGNKNNKNNKNISLDEKIEIWGKKNKDQPSDAEEPDLSHEEWQRAKTAMNKNQTAKEAWENARNLSRGNVQKAKRQAMVAWLMDPSFGRCFQQYIQTVSYGQRHTTTERPETFKQLLSAMMRRKLRPWWMLGTISALVFCTYMVSKNKLSYSYTCQICWSDERHLHAIKLNHCSMLRNHYHVVSLRFLCLCTNLLMMLRFSW